MTRLETYITYIGAPYSKRKDCIISSSSTESHKIWIEQCAATESIRERFGLKNALDYLIGEKLFTFVVTSEQNPDFAAELPAFLAAICRLFSTGEIREYLDTLEQTKFLALSEPEIDDAHQEEEEPWPTNPGPGRRGTVAVLTHPATPSVMTAVPWRAMTKPKKDPLREDRIHNEVIVDTYGPEEQALSWYYYLENKMRFPFKSRCFVARVVSPLRKGETVEVRRMAPEEACSRDMLVLIRWQGRNLAVPLSQLTPTGVDETTAEAVSDWHYWVAQGYLF